MSSPGPASILLASALSFAAVNAAVHAAATGAALDEHPVDLQSPNLLQARLGGFFDGPSASPRVVFAGDSVLAGRNLLDEHGESWVGLTMPAATQAASGGAVRVLNLGVEGVLWGDVDCMVQLLLAQGVDGLVLHLNPRPFASDFDDPSAQLSRPWICDAAWEGALGTALTAVAGAVPVVRWRGLVQDRLFGGPLRHRATGALAGLAGRPPPLSAEDAEDEALLADALWRIRAAGRANDVTVSEDHASYAALSRLLGRLRGAEVPTVLLYVGEDIEAIAQQLDRAHYEQERAAFLAMVEAEVAGAPTLSFLPIPTEDLDGAYDDHVHLTARGYETVAGRVWAEMQTLLAREKPAVD